MESNTERVSHFKVENRSRVKFLKDTWCGNSALNISFLSLFALANSKDARVAII